MHPQEAGDGKSGMSSSVRQVHTGSPAIDDGWPSSSPAGRSMKAAMAGAVSVKTSEANAADPPLYDNTFSKYPFLVDNRPEQGAIGVAGEGQPVAIGCHQRELLDVRVSRS